MSETGFWDDREKALETVAALKGFQCWTIPVKEIEIILGDLETAVELLEFEEDARLSEETSEKLTELEKKLNSLEFRQMFSGPHDRNNSILTIRSGAGGIDSQDWAEMLLRMYMHWSEKQEFLTEILSLQTGEEAGIREAVISVKGLFSYGYLRAENGIHRLVRKSPFDQNHRRHTSFASVFSIPELDESVEIKIRNDDIKLDTFRASGAGGQHVNKTSSAVRITHLPSGIVVSCQNQRSQFRNRELAMKILRARLYDLEEKKHMEKRAELEGEKKDVSWGNQIRSYVLHPYRMVKDHRTGIETSGVDNVLSGDIQHFIEAYLRMEN